MGGLTGEDYANFDKFAGRARELGELATARNCKLYVDAEQTFIQAAIESFGQQMTQQLNRGDTVTIMNGY